MNIIKYKLSSYNISNLNLIKKCFLNKIIWNKNYILLNIFLFFKWQITNRLNSHQIFEYSKKSFTVLRSPFVNKNSREQYSIRCFKTLIFLNSIFNNKYSLSFFFFNNISIFFKNKQYYLKKLSRNCYFFKN